MRAADDDTPSLPDDPEALRALLLSVTAERDALAARNEQLHHLLLKLKRRQFGSKSERLPEDQLLFVFEEIEAALAVCLRTCRGSSGCWSRTQRPARAARARWWRSAAMPRSGWT
ncbi:transposase [Belnapia sp. T18]|uniref:Transposase n=1 Tax=Belnapia arida TaxID=2804533 RepID=A0ABS1UBW5_9PROT|nr:transposase [Belnapia arida]MBL6082178.1 transposase [Belnapia arida]